MLSFTKTMVAPKAMARSLQIHLYNYGICYSNRKYGNNNACVWKSMSAFYLGIFVWGRKGSSGKGIAQDVRLEGGGQLF